MSDNLFTNLPSRAIAPGSRPVVFCVGTAGKRGGCTTVFPEEANSPSYSWVEDRVEPGQKRVVDPQTGQPRGRILCNSCFDYYEAKWKRMQAQGKVPAEGRSQRAALFTQVGTNELVTANTDARRGVPGVIPVKRLPSGAPGGPSQSSSKQKFLPPISQPRVASWTTPGYTINHQHHSNAIKVNAACAAYAPINNAIGDQIDINVTLRHLPKGANIERPSVIGLINSHLTVATSISAKDLKEEAFRVLYPLSLEYSGGLKFTVNDVSLHLGPTHKDLIEAATTTETPSQIFEYCYKSIKSGRKLLESLPPKRIIYLYVNPTLYANIETSRMGDRMDIDAGINSIDEDMSDLPHSPALSTIKGKKRTIAKHLPPTAQTHYSMPDTSWPEDHAINPDELDQSDHEQPPESRSKTEDSAKNTTTNLARNKAWQPPARTEIASALRNQGNGDVYEVPTLVSAVSKRTHVYPVANKSIAELVKNKGYDIFGRDTTASPADIRIGDEIDSGSFKTTNAALLDPKTASRPSSGIFSHSNIVVKQFYQTQKGGKRRHARPKEVALCATEAQIAQWAASLMDLADGFTQDKIQAIGEPEFIIPSMRFVDVAVAIVDEPKGNAFILKELIDSATDGQFRKYIGNGSSVPLPLKRKHDLTRAEYLTYIQHVQYVHTGGLAFVTDFQGGRTLLTDPQIITNPELGKIFSSANIPQTFELFPVEHVCSKFCKWAELAPFNYFQEGIDDDEVMEGSNSAKDLVVKTVASKVGPESEEDPSRAGAAIEISSSEEDDD